MPRMPTITFEDFSVAADDLVRSGQGLTFAAVRQRLGGGSYDVLRRYIDKYAEEQKDRYRDNKPGVPDFMRGGMQALYDQALAEATRQIRAELEADAQALAADREAMEQEHADMQQRLVRAETEARMLQQRVVELTEDRAHLHGRVDAERQRVLELEVTLSTAQGALDTERDMRLAVMSAAAGERHELIERFAADLDRAQTRFEGLQQHTLRMVDEIRTKHVEVVEKIVEDQVASVAKQLAIGTAAVAKLPERVIDFEAAAARIDRTAESVAAAIDGSTRQVIQEVQEAARQTVAAAAEVAARRPERKSSRVPKGGQGT